MKISTAAALASLDQPTHERAAVFYDPSRLDGPEDRPFDQPLPAEPCLLGADLLRRLDAVAGPQPGVAAPALPGGSSTPWRPTDRQRAWQCFVGDLAWGSSRLEGASYSRTEVDALLHRAVWAEEKPRSDGALVCNHRMAMARLGRWLGADGIQNGSLSASGPGSISPFPVDLVLGIHSDLTRSPEEPCPDLPLTLSNGAADAWPHMLPEAHRGVFRSYAPNRLLIDGSAYVPPQAEGRSANAIADEAVRLLANAQGWACNHPVDGAFFLLSRWPYLQPFRDGNKRTSRVLANAPLLQAGWAPMSYGTMDRSEYHRGLVAFYEFGGERVLARQVIGQVVEAQWDRMHRTEAEQKEWRCRREGLMAALVDFVVDNVPLDVGRVPGWVRNDRNGPVAPMSDHRTDYVAVSTTGRLRSPSPR